MGTPEPLPRADEAHVPLEKLAGYCLNTDHPGGKHKARVFKSALGITAADASFLRDQILEAIQTTPISGIDTTSPFGILYAVRVSIDGLNGAIHPVITAWFIGVDDEDPPRLVSAYVDVP